MTPEKKGALIGAGAMADVYAYGADVVKLYRKPELKALVLQEAANLEIAALHDLPVPAVLEVGELAGLPAIVVSRAPGTPLMTEAIATPDTLSAALDEMVRLQLAMHAIRETRLRPLHVRLREKIELSPGLEIGLRTSLLGRLDALPEGDRICHGDFHPLNIVVDNGSPTIIDWLDATSGAPEADVCRSYVIFDQVNPEIAAAYVGLYARAAGIGENAVYDWLPVVAAARLNENVSNKDRLLVLASKI